MKINVKDTDINYIQYGQGKDIILLHGWGQNIAMMKPIGDALQNKFRITILDLPGFGDSSEPPFNWTLLDYNDMLEKFIQKLNLKNPILIGHSFGGRLAIIYASKNKAEKIVLFAAPMIKRIEKQSTKTKILKSLKKVPLLNKSADFFKKHIGSNDYKNASPRMREILVNTVNFDGSSYASKITAPTIYIIGTNDQAVSINEAQIIEKTIANCGLIIYENKTHYAYLEDINKTISILNNFL